MASLENPEKKAAKNRVPNAFMIFVKEKAPELLNKCPGEDKAQVGAYLGREWRSMSVEEKRVYFDKYKALKKIENDASDSNSTMVKEKMAHNETKICSDEGNITKDKRAVDKSFTAGESFNKFQNGTTNTDGFEKKKPLKKTRRSPNAFMIFAREQRRTTVTPSATNEKKSHKSTVLGSMWRELPDVQKAKYYHEAKRLHTNLQMELKTDSPRTISKNKVQFETVSETPVSRTRKKKEFRSVISTDLKNQEVNDTEKTEIESNSKKTSDVVENAGITNCLSVENRRSRSLQERKRVEELLEKIANGSDISDLSEVESNDEEDEWKALNEASAGLNNACNTYPNSSYLQQHNSALGNFHRLPPSAESHHSNACCYPSAPPSYFNGSASLNQNSASDACMSRSCFGSGSFQPAFPSYPYNIPPWMYHQPMAHPCFPLPSPFFYPSPYNCSLPYSYNSTYNDNGSYFGYYSTQYSRRIVESSTYAGSRSSTTSATAVSANSNEESTEAEKRGENSDVEQLVVDEGYPNEKQPQENGTT